MLFSGYSRTCCISIKLEQILELKLETKVKPRGKLILSIYTLKLKRPCLWLCLNSVRPKRGFSVSAEPKRFGFLVSRTEPKLRPKHGFFKFRPKLYKPYEIGTFEIQAPVSGVH